ncbi:MAG: transporter [Xanthomonadaceae bacterium]|nr:transporter [Xanthomonadaceae bacterium]MDE2278172.1 transporter [Xanthomonadaceae bacterium]MDE2316548.1 transporter [Xanthomonadaceae bacterium]
MLACTGALAGPITFNTALPVSQGELLFQQTLLYRTLEDGTVVPGMQTAARAGVSVLAYGVNGKLTVFGMAPYADKTLDMVTPMGPVHRTNHGLGDSTFFIRYTVYQDNRRGASFRIAPLLGVVTPTGRDAYRDAYGTQPRMFQPGSGTWGALGGVVVTYQTLDYEFDSSLTYRGNGRHAGYSPGSATEFDASFQYRLLPRVLGGGVPRFLYGVLETNLIHTGRSIVDDRAAVASGGTEWFIAPGLEYVTPRWVLQGAVQIPVQRNVDTGALRDRRIYHLALRFNF